MKVSSYRVVIESSTREPVISPPVATLAEATSVLSLFNNEHAQGSLWVEALIEGDPVWHEVDLHDGEAHLDGESLSQV